MSALRNPQLILVAAVVGVAIVGSVLRSPAPRQGFPPPPEAPSPPVRTLAHLEAAVPQITAGLEKVAYTADSLRDPFVSLLPTGQSAIVKVVTSGEYEQGSSGEQATLPALKVRGIIWGGARPQAFIDGEVYDVGDTVQGTRIIGIDRTGVTGEVKGKLVRWVPE